VCSEVVAVRRRDKSQLAWFRNAPHMRWLSGLGDDPTTVSAVEKLVAGQMRASAASSSGPALGRASEPS